MATFREEMHDLFSMFHDFDLFAIKQGDNIVTLTIGMSWGQLWDEDEIYEIRLELHGCEYFYCNYQESVHPGPYKSNEEINFEVIEHSTKDIATIIDLKLSIQAHESKEPDHYIFHCRSGMKNINEGQIMFTANRYLLFDKTGNSLSLDKMKELATLWWNHIQKTWDEQDKAH